MSHKVRPLDELNKQLNAILFSEDNSLISNLILRATEKIIQQALEEEMNDFLGRRWYEHKPDKEFRGYRNGYQKRRFKTSEGTINIQKPRVRDNQETFESNVMQRLDRIEDKIEQIALESYVRGLSTRDIEKTFTDQDGKPLISRTGVSNMSSQLYQQYEEFASRDLSELDVVYLFIDGVYESVKNYTNKQGILCAWAICSNGSKELLHLMASNSEASANWEGFFEDMIGRGLRQPLLIVSDGAKGVIRAISQCFPNAQRQRCIAHKIRNILTKVPMKVEKEIKGRIKSIYYAPDRDTADALSARFISDYAEQFPAMIKCFTDDLSACLTHLEYPEGHRRSIRTTNLIERAFVEEKRRTKIIPQHAHEKGAIGLVFSVLIRASLSWRKVNMSELDKQILKHIRTIISPESADSELISYKLSA